MGEMELVNRADVGILSDDDIKTGFKKYCQLRYEMLKAKKSLVETVDTHAKEVLVEHLGALRLERDKWKVFNGLRSKQYSDVRKEKASKKALEMQNLASGEGI